MELLIVIRRWHYRDHMPIREIEGRTGLSRNTVRKYLRSDAVEVRFKVPKRPSRLDPFADKLSRWLEMEAGEGRKVRRTARRLHADLVVLGYDGSYARVAAFIRHWRADREVAQHTTGRGVFVPLVFPAGDAFQFDWNEDWAVLGGKRVKLQVAHTKLAYSRMRNSRNLAKTRRSRSCTSSSGFKVTLLSRVWISPAGSGSRSSPRAAFWRSP